MVYTKFKIDLKLRVQLFISNFEDNFYNLNLLEYIFKELNSIFTRVVI